MYSNIQELERKNADERLRRKGVSLQQFAGATQAAADMTLHAHEWDNIPDGEPLVIQDKMGKLQAYAGLEYPVNPDA